MPTEQTAVVISEITKIADIPLKTAPAGIIGHLVDFLIYRDEFMKEHLYTVSDADKRHLNRLPKRIREWYEAAIKIAGDADCAYIRFTHA